MATVNPTNEVDNGETSNESSTVYQSEWTTVATPRISRALSNLSARELAMFIFLLKVQDYMYIAIGLVAIVGNSLNLLVLFRHQRSLSPYTYMAALAGCDLGSGLCLIWMGIIQQRDLHFTSHVARQLYYYTVWPVFGFNEALAMSSGLLATVLSLDRLVAVCFPLQRSLWCTVRRARWVAAIIVVFSMLINVHYILRIQVVWTWDGVRNVAIPLAIYTPLAYNKTMNDFSCYAGFIFKMVVPLGIMLVTNSLTLVTIHRSRMFRQKAASTSGQAAKSTSESAQCLAITVGVVVGFFVTQAPRSWFYVDSISSGLKHRGFFAFEVCIVVGMILAWFNTNVNFFIYAAVSKTFPEQLSTSVICKPVKNKDASSEHSESTVHSTI